VLELELAAASGAAAGIGYHAGERGQHARTGDRDDKESEEEEKDDEEEEYGDDNDDDLDGDDKDDDDDGVEFGGMNEDDEDEEDDEEGLEAGWEGAAAWGGGTAHTPRPVVLKAGTASAVATVLDAVDEAKAAARRALSAAARAEGEGAKAAPAQRGRLSLRSRRLLLRTQGHCGDAGDGTETAAEAEAAAAGAASLLGAAHALSLEVVLAQVGPVTPTDLAIATAAGCARVVTFGLARGTGGGGGSGGGKEGRQLTKAREDAARALDRQRGVASPSKGARKAVRVPVEDFSTIQGLIDELLLPPDPLIPITATPLAPQPLAK